MDPTAGTPLAAHRPRPGPSEPVEQQRWTCRVVPDGARRHVLHLSGSLQVEWAGRLAAGLAARHVNVARASARRDATRWTAEIVVDVPDPRFAPSVVDVVALMREPAGPLADEPGPRLTAFDLAARSRDLEVRVHARDEVGFLGRLLAVFARLDLFPRDLEVETVGAEVRDVFRLQGRAGTAPPAAVAALLRRRLEELAAPH